MLIPRHMNSSKEQLCHALQDRACIPQNAAGVLSLPSAVIPQKQDSTTATHLAITGLFSCVGIAMWHNGQQRGLMAHLDSDHTEQPQNIPNMIKIFFATMDCQVQELEVTLIYAKDNLTPARISRDPLYKSKYQLIQLLTEALATYPLTSPLKTISEHDVESRALNLATGELVYYRESENPLVVRRHDSQDDSETTAARAIRLHHPATLKYFSLHNGIPVLLGDKTAMDSPRLFATSQQHCCNAISHSPAQRPSGRYRAYA